MSAFRYKHGDKPLDGFTIQHAAGRGGFGEVYYALSDSGREVALKVIQGYEHIELRGVGHCMNLKSPHLVSIFDVKKNTDGLPFIIMEFVSGPSLRQIIDESPGGLGTQKAAFFLREIAKGLQYLHDCGIVHRDLKPGNIFYENPYVKIGDYGLSKAMTASQHSGQTITVGTVHYMAPEIGVGKYDRSIDIYALGAVLFEMLTGQPPYLGASPGEILMKHLSAVPDVSNIEEPFATAITRAMNKDPRQRFQSVQEMVEAVFGAEHVRNSVSGFSPDSLTMVAGRIAQRVGAGQAVGMGAGGFGGAIGGSSAIEPFSPDRTPPPSDAWMGMGNLVDRAGNRIGALADRFSGAADVQAPAPDPIPLHQRVVLGSITLLVISCATGAAAGKFTALSGFFALLAASGMTLGLLLCRKLFARSLKDDDYYYWRIPIAGIAMLMALAFSGVVIAGASGNLGGSLWSTLVAAGIALCIYNWRVLMAPTRERRVAGQPIFYTCLAGLILSGMFGGSGTLAAGILAAVTLASQILAPFQPGAYGKPVRKRKHKAEKQDADLTIAMPPPIPPLSPRLSPAPLLVPSTVPSPSQSAAHAHTSLSGVSLTSIATFPIALGGHIALILSALLGLVLAVDLPAALASGIFSAEAKAELDKEFNSQSWHTLMRSVGYVLLCVTIFAANALLLFARRWNGVAHMIRALLASILLLGAVRFLHEACSANWIALSKNPATAQPDSAIQAFLSAIAPVAAGFALVLALVSLVIVLWPPRRHPQPSIIQEPKP